MKILHFLLNAVGVPLWLLSYFLMYVVMLMAMLGTKLVPDADSGNCFTYALPKWKKEGGKLVFSMSPINKWAPRLEWVDESGVTSHVTPLNPATKLSSIWRIFYFKYRVVKR